MTKKLKFCLCTTFYPPYNSDADGFYVQRLANGLAKLGHEVTVLHNPDAYEVLTGKKVIEAYDDHPSITIKKVISPLKRLSLLAIQQTGKPYGQKSRLQECFNEPFDVIHYYNISLLGGPEIFSYGQSTIKIGGLNDHWLVCPMHLLWKYTNEVCETPQCLTCSVRNGKPPQLWRYTDLMENMTQHVDMFLGPSLFTIHKHLERGFKRPMIHLPPLYTIPEKGNDMVKPLPVQGPFFLCIGRLEPYKGFQDVIPLFKNFPKCNLVICGQGSYSQPLQSLAKDLSNVVFTGPISQSRIQVLYENALATIVPSLCYQTFCHITAESYSAGTPVIANKLSAVEEMITEHGGGILYTNSEELHQAITTVIANGQTKQVLKKEAYQAYCQEYSEEVYLQRYLGIVRELLSQKTQFGKIRDYDAEHMTFAGRKLAGI
jgi:glycosyltransferase involved in cell wall biosynthesis